MSRALGLVAALWEERGVWHRWVPVDYASHSAQMQVLEESLGEVLAGIGWRAAQVPFYSSVTGDVVDTATLDGRYWFDNLRGTVRFAAAMEQLLTAGYRGFVEVSAHPVLTAAVEDVADAHGVSSVMVTGSLRREESDRRQFLSAVGQVFVGGHEVDWSAVVPVGVRVGLPTYAFQRQRFWLSGSAAGDPVGLGQRGTDHPLLGAAVELR